MKKLHVAIALCMGLSASVAFASAPVHAAAAQTGSSGGNMSSAIQDKAFYNWFTKDLATKVKANPKYDKIPLKTKAQANQFMGWLHATYRDKMTSAQFKQRVLKAYPGHQYEVDYIISLLPDSK